METWKTIAAAITRTSKCQPFEQREFFVGFCFFCATNPKQGKQQWPAWQHQSFRILHLHATDGSPATATATAAAAKREIRHKLAAGTVLSLNAALAALLLGWALVAAMAM